MAKVFFAFPSQPDIIPSCYSTALPAARKANSKLRLKSWPELKINGQIIWQAIVSEIETCDIFVADITVLNNNVLYEVGYAVALRKPIILYINRSLPDQDSLRTRLGLFDIIGHDRYKDAAELADKISLIRESKTAFPISNDIDYRAPVFLLDSYQKDGLSSSVYSWVHKLIVHF